jgi:hypothetical protein
LPELAAEAEHDATSVGPVVTLAQVVSTWLLPAVGPELAEHDANGTGVTGVVTVRQVVAT